MMVDLAEYKRHNDEWHRLFAEECQRCDERAFLYRAAGRVVFLATCISPWPLIPLIGMWSLLVMVAGWVVSLWLSSVADDNKYTGYIIARDYADKIAGKRGTVAQRVEGE